jgi:ribosome-binding factor A
MAEAIREELMDIILTELKDPRIGITSITHVDVSKDLKHAKISLSVLGDETARAESLAALKKASGRIRKSLGKRIRFRCLPELVFNIDMTVEHSLRIQEILKEIETEADKKPGGDDAL